ncbi:hypothetical protein JYU11_01825 [bacterium AH-315-G05]|nr:hypothetical protein [bacterium AH-315-G05]
MRSGNTKDRIYEIAVFTRALGDLKFVENAQGHTIKVPVSELEVCIAVRV